MSERKVIQKYYPPDFDPTKIPRMRRPKDAQVTVRMMMPMSVRCNTCGEYIYRGKKFNSKKETVQGEEYLGIKIFRFYMRCPNCSSEFTIRTDPEHSDYLADMGCSRNFEPWRDKETQIEEAKKQREKEEEGDAMKALENRTLDSKVEMDIIEALDEIRALNARNSQIDADTLLEQHKRTYENKDNEFPDAEEHLLQNVVFKSSSTYVKRLEEDSKSQSIDEPPAKRLKEKEKVTPSIPPPSSISFLPITKKKEEKKIEDKLKIGIQPKIIPTSENKSTISSTSNKNSSSTSLLGSLVDYGDDAD